MSNYKISNGVVHKVPEDLRKMLESDSKMLVAWESLTTLARNEWICWIISVKRAATRTEHIARARSELKEGKRRPCCWYGCVHRRDKPVSPSVQKLVLDRKHKGKKQK